MPVIAVNDLRTLVTSILVEVGASGRNAGEVADVLVENHLAGHDSHGVLRLPRYLAAIRSGRIDPVAVPRIVRQTPVTALVHGNRAFGQVIGNYVADVAVDKVSTSGLAVVSVAEANHTGRLGAFTERAARRGVAMCLVVGTVNNRSVVPFGGRTPVFGTNPIAFSMPNPCGPPVTLDFATSAIAAGKIRLARAEGRTVPPKSILDSGGRPSVNPEDYFQGGSLLPFGDHKGYALAVIAEILANAFNGVSPAQRQGSTGGAFAFALSTDLFGAGSGYHDAIADVIERVHTATPAEGVDRVRVPGEPEEERRRERLNGGVPIADETWTQVLGIAEEVGIPPPQD